MTTINAPHPGTLHFSVPGTLAIAEGTERLGVVVLDKAGNVTTAERTLHLINPVQGRLSDKIELIRLYLLGNDVSPEERDQDDALVSLWSALFRLDLHNAQSLKQRVQDAIQRLGEYPDLIADLQEMSAMLYDLGEAPGGPLYEGTIFPVIDLEVANALEASLDGIRESIAGSTSSAVSHLRIILRSEDAFVPKVLSHLYGELYIQQKTLAESPPCAPGSTKRECEQQQELDFCDHWAPLYCNWHYLRCVCNTLFQNWYGPGALAGGAVGYVVGSFWVGAAAAYVFAAQFINKGICYATMAVYCPWEPSRGSYPVDYYQSLGGKLYKTCATVPACVDEVVEESAAC